MLKHWNSIRERQGLLYRVFEDVRHRECHQLLLPLCLKKPVLDYKFGTPGPEHTVFEEQVYLDRDAQ